MECVFKVAVIGSPGSGKTTLLAHWFRLPRDFRELHSSSTSPFAGACEQTIAVDLSAFVIDNCREEARFRLQFWDVQGDAADLSTTLAAIRNAAVVLVLCDVSNAASLEHTRRMVQVALDEGMPSRRVLVTANKCDLLSTHDAQAAGSEVSRAAKDATNMGLVSATDGSGVATLLAAVVDRIAEEFLPNAPLAKPVAPPPSVVPQNASTTSGSDKSAPSVVRVAESDSESSRSQPASRKKKPSGPCCC